MKFDLKISYQDKKLIEDFIFSGTNHQNKKLIATVKKIKKYLKDDKYNYILLRDLNKKKKNFYDTFVKLCKLFGKFVYQNSNKDKIIKITPKVNKINKHALKNSLRYHQTNTGGSYHSDGPQLINPPFILLMGCEENSSKGGETVIINILEIFKELKKNNNNILKILQEKFYFERRGFKKNDVDVTFQKKIFNKSQRNLKFRYLREYILNGYKIRKLKISAKKLFAINELDKLMSRKRFLSTIKLQRGDVIIINNYKTAHGRKKFKIDQSYKRSILRAWVN